MNLKKGYYSWKTGRHKLKCANKKRLEKLEKQCLEIRDTFRVIYDQSKPFPKIEKKGPCICLPDNGRRFPVNEVKEIFFGKP